MLTLEELALDEKALQAIMLGVCIFTILDIGITSLRILSKESIPVACLMQPGNTLMSVLESTVKTITVSTKEFWK